VTAGSFSYSTLDDPSGSTWPFAINDLGQITGTSSSGGFLFSNGNYTPINDPSANVDSTEPRGINNAGEIVGLYSTGTTNHGFLYSGGNFTTVDVPGSSNTYATDINASGQIVGYSDSGSFLYSGGNYTIFNDPLGFSLAQGINSAGQIVGAYVDNTGKHMASLTAAALLQRSMTR
jgi:probable HAF family extracellular repeat protein